ncbi:MAG: YdeI/OmpD-associated family protein [Chthoniobacterales bacterium]
MSLPEAIESSHVNHPDFRVGGKIFATLWADDERGVLLLTPEQQAALVASAPKVFASVKGGWGLRGSTSVHLPAAKAPILRDALQTAWQRVAPKRLLAESLGKVKTDPRIDAYIAQAAAFARPILQHLRKVVHAGCPEVQETVKWSSPHFEYKGPLCGMAAFKAHCAFGFWKASLILGDGVKGGRDAMGHFGRITTLADLPPEKVLVGYVRKAAKLNDTGAKDPTKARKARAALPTPDYLTEALRTNAKARAHFAKLSPSCRREYIEWLTEAKREETREKRLATTLEWLAEGKSRNWKYERC